MSFQEFCTSGQDFKNKESTEIVNGPFIILRMDGKAFHTYTKSFNKPYDIRIMSGMDNAAITAIKEVFNTGFICAYTQSDEISIILDWRLIEKPFGGRIEKLVSVGASAVTAGFIQEVGLEHGLPLFDARVITLDTIEEIGSYLYWRRLDCQKNAITMAAETLYNYKELRGVSTKQRKELLKGTQYETLPDEFYWGRLIYTKPTIITGTFTHSKTGEIGEYEATRNTLVIEPATRENVELLLLNQVN